MYTEEQKRQVYYWWDVFHRENGFTEVRVLGNTVYSGMFSNVENLIRDLDLYGNEGTAYFVFNQLDKACYEKTQRERLVASGFKGKKNLTTGNDDEVKMFRYVFIDIDCCRPADTNSTDAEKEHAHKKALEVYDFLTNNGFSDMIVCDSANGYHIFIPCEFAATKENADMVQRFLGALAMRFSDEDPHDSSILAAEIDLKVYNPARLAKLPGSFSFKGSSDSIERPQRMGRILLAPNSYNPNRKAYFEKIADEYPEEVKPDKWNHYSTSFNLDEFIQKHGIEVREVKRVADGTRYVLDHCLFNPNHRGKDACIFQRNNGAISYFCYHNSCSSYRWRDVRLMFEPDAYNKSDYEEFNNRRDYNSSIPKEPPRIIEESTEKGKKWLNPSDIKWHDPKDDVHIPSGFTKIDEYMGGWCLPDTTVVTGLPASGKSTWINNVVLNAIQHGYNVGVWSGELIASRFMGWMRQVAAGKKYVRLKEGYDDWWYAPENVSQKINTWLDGKFFLYNNDYGNNESQLFADMESAVKEKNIRLFVLDNLAAMTLDGAGDRLEKQIDFINRLNEFTKKTMTHILVVIHPRKQDGLIRLESIGGARELYGLACNAIVVHRLNEDFRKRASEFFGTKRVNELFELGYDNVIEVMKNREQGDQDKLFGVFYEKATRRYKNDIAEYIHYNWENPEDVQKDAEREANGGWTQEEYYNYQQSDDMPDFEEFEK